MFSASLVPSKSLSAASSTSTNSSSGLASAASTVAADRANPTATVVSQPSEIMASRFGAKSVSESDCASANSAPSSSAAFFAPS